MLGCISTSSIRWNATRRTVLEISTVVVMGTENGLLVGGFYLLYGKNSFYVDLSPLFSKSKVRSYKSEGYELTTAYESVSIIKTKLDLMGMTMEYCRNSYGKYYPNSPVGFDLFLAILENIDLSKIKCGTSDRLEYEDSDCFSFWDYVTRKFPNYFKHGEESILDESTEKMNDLVLLRIFCEISTFQQLTLDWNIFETINSGYYSEDEIFHPLKDVYKTVIVTEGSSDTSIIKRTIEAYFPQFVDFFIFIDMDKNYPFPGCGKMWSFFQGVVKINQTSRTLFVLDNDTEGNQTYDSMISLKHQSNIGVCRLPHLPCMENVLIRYPLGDDYGDVNGRAVSIECFLDLTPIHNSPVFELDSFNRKMKEYQGRISQKTDLKKSISKIGKPNYDCHNLIILINHIFSEIIKLNNPLCDFY